MKTVVAKEARKFNFRSTPDKRLTVSAQEVPTLVPAETMAMLTAGDEDPYFKIQEIPVPVKANRVTYPASFFESYLSKLSDRPIPGSKNGHDMRYGARPNTDLYLVGGKLSVDSQGNGKVYLKNYIPRVGESGDNSAFILQNRAGMLDYSIVSYTKDEIETMPEGEMKITAVASIAGERNDAVEYGTGAMEQKTNASSQSLDEAVAGAMELIADGRVERNSAWSPDEGDIELAPGYPIGRNGLVFRSALRRQAARAAQDGLSQVAEAASELLRCVDTKTQANNRRTNVNKEELLQRLVTLKQNGELSLVEVASAMGLQGQVVTEEVTNMVRQFNAIKEIVGDSPLDAVKKLQAAVKDNEATARANKLEKEFGAAKNSAGNENMLRTYAEQKLNSVAFDKLDDAIKVLKESDTIAKKLAAENADQNTETNQVFGRSSKQNSNELVDAGGVVVL